MNTEKVVELTANLKEALDRLEEALKEAPEEYKSEILLKRFEFSFELAMDCLFKRTQFNRSCL